MLLIIRKQHLMNLPQNLDHHSKERFRNVTNLDASEMVSQLRIRKKVIRVAVATAALQARQPAIKPIHILQATETSNGKLFFAEHFATQEHPQPAPHRTAM